MKAEEGGGRGDGINVTNWNLFIYFYMIFVIDPKNERQQRFGCYAISPRNERESSIDCREGRSNARCVYQTHRIHRAWEQQGRSKRKKHTPE